MSLVDFVDSFDLLFEDRVGFSCEKNEKLALKELSTEINILFISEVMPQIGWDILPASFEEFRIRRICYFEGRFTIFMDYPTSSPDIKVCVGGSMVDDFLSEKVKDLPVIPQKGDVLYFQDDERCTEYFLDQYPDYGCAMPPLTVQWSCFYFNERGKCTLVELEIDAV